MCTFNRILRADALLLFACITCLVVGQDRNASDINFELYISENQRMYRESVDYFETNIADFKSTYLQQLTVLDQLSSQLELKVHTAYNQLQSTEAFSSAARDCVAPRRMQFPDRDSVLRLSDCIANGRSSQYKFVDPLAKRVRTLNSFYKKTLVETLTKCQQNLTIPDSTPCITTAIDNATDVTSLNRLEFDVALKQAKVTAEIRLNEVIKCCLDGISEVVSKITKTLDSVKDCLYIGHVPPSLIATLNSN